MISANESQTRIPHSHDSSTGTLADVMRDVLSLLELQIELLKEDLSEIHAGVTRHMVFLILGCVLLLAALPVILGGLGALLATATGWSLGFCLLLTAIVCGAIPGATAVIYALRLIRRQTKVIYRSTSEFNENMRWLKRRLKSL